MVLPCHSTSKKKTRKTSGSLNKGWAGVKQKDLLNFNEELGEKFEYTLHDFQQEAIKGQLQRKDVLVHAGTGSGKTLIAAGPHAHPLAKGLVTFMISPLIALQEEQVLTFRNEFKLTATAVNSTHGGCTEEIMADICRGKWQIVLISPEIILSKRFVKNVLRKPEMGARILSIVIDEAHVVSHWGAGFRKHYSSLGILRALTPKGTPFVAMSATLAPRVRKDVLSKLQYHSDDYIDLNIGNDRPNVSIVVRAIQNTMNTFSDLDFLIPDGIQQPEDIKKTFLYVDQISSQVDIEERLHNRLPSTLRNKGIIQPYSAAFSSEHRMEVMSLFKAGAIRILICTDAAGMGCNIPDVDLVVQWKLPATVSTFVQRAGRAARGSGRTGLAVLLVEKSVYEADLSRLDEASLASGKKKTVRQSSTYPKASKKYATDHGVLRGSFGGTSDKAILAADVPIDYKSADEGLYTLAQTSSCRRKVLAAIYANSQPCPTVSCCDLCDPSLLDLTRPAPPAAAQKTPPLKLGMPNERVRAQLRQWRDKVWRRDFDDAVFASSGILSDKVIENLASFGPVLRLIDLERVVGSQWPWFGRYGDELLTELLGMSISPAQSKPSQSRGTKQRFDQPTSGPGLVDAICEEATTSTGKKQRKQKRSHADESHSRENLPNPTPVSSMSTSVACHPSFNSVPSPLTSTTAYNRTLHAQYPSMFPYPYYGYLPTTSFPLTGTPYGYYPFTPPPHGQVLWPSYNNFSTPQSGSNNNNPHVTRP